MVISFNINIPETRFTYAVNFGMGWTRPLMFLAFATSDVSWRKVPSLESNPLVSSFSVIRYSHSGKWEIHTGAQ